MTPEPSFGELMDRLRAGEQQAATLLFQRFAQRLVELARGRLNSRLRPKLDAEDVVQSALKSFFVRVTEGEFELENWEGLWSLLVVITLRKCGRKLEYFRASCRDIARETAGNHSSDLAESWAAVAREPTPLEAAVLTETLNQIAQSLSDRQRQVFDLRLQGYTTPEISARVERSEHTVHWILKRMRKRLCRLRDELAGSP